MTANTEIQFSSPALAVEFSGGRYTITREGKGDSLVFDRSQLVRHGWAPVTGTSLRHAVTLHWDWRCGEDVAYVTDHRGVQSPYGTLSEVLEELAFLHIS